MPKLTDVINTFKTGDIVITQRIESARVFHTTMILQPAHSPINKLSFAHAGDRTEVCETSAYEKETPAPYRHYSCPNANIGGSVAAQAAQWSDRRTSYGNFPSSQNAAIGGGTNANRYSGMVTTASLDEIPFDINALKRVLKWVEKSYKNEPLSLNRGITCCAFISACYQTTCMKKYLELNHVKNETVYEVNAQLQKQFGSKPSALLPDLVTTAKRGTVEKGTKLGHVGQALRNNSNRPVLESSALHGKSIEDQWEFIQTNLFKIGDWTGKKLSINKIIPPFVFYDVKYMNTKLLETSLIANGWKYTDYDQY